MYMIDQEKTVDVLLNREGWTPLQVKFGLKTYPPLNDVFSESFDKWLETGEIIDVTVDGFTITHAMRMRHYSYIQAVRLLNSLLDPSMQGADRESVHRILNTPIVIR